jgi:hypothetical protein
LLNLLRSVVAYTAGVVTEETYGLGPKSYYHPYEELYFHLPDLLSYKNGSSGLRANYSEQYNQKCDEHIDLLSDCLKAQAKIPFDDFNIRLARTIPVVTFGTYWLLLLPGTDMCVREADGSLNAYIMTGWTGGIAATDGKRTISHYRLSVWNLVFDGTKIVPCIRLVEVNVFDNERQITSLSVFPAAFVDEKDDGQTRGALVSR